MNYADTYIARARITNVERDIQDRREGRAVPKDQPLSYQVQLAREAIRAGLNGAHTDVFAEAWVLLENVVRELEAAERIN